MQNGTKNFIEYEGDIMKELLHKFSLLMMFLYITSIYIFSYNKELYVVSNTIFIVLAGAAALYIMLRGNIIIPKSMYTMFFFYMIMVASYFWIVKDMNATRGNLTMILMIAIVGIIVNLLTEEKHIDLILKMIFFAGIAMCIYSLSIYGFKETIDSLASDMGVRLGKEISQENVFGIACSITVALGLYYAYYERKGIYYIITLLPVIYALSSGSRKVILILIIALIILIITKKGRSKTTTFLITLMSAGIVFIILNYLSSLDLFIFERFESFLNVFEEGNINSDSSAIKRMEMIKQGIKWFMKKPILGYGIDQYSVMFYLDYGIKMYSHSNIIEILVNFGVVGFIIYYSLYIYMFVFIIKAIQRKIPKAVAMLLIFGVLTVTNIFSVVIYSKQTYILIGIVLAFINLNKEKLRKIPEETVDCDSEGEV